MSEPFKEITADQLVKELRDGATDIIIVDVRDDDYRVGGHIRGSINIPANDFQKNAKEYSADFPPGSRVVFHCMHSTRRGPNSARVLAQINEELKRINPPQPYLLVGGFQAVANRTELHDVLE